MPAGPKLLALFLAIRPGAFFLSNCRQNCRSVTRVNRNRNRHRGGGGGGAGGGDHPPPLYPPLPQMRAIQTKVSGLAVPRPVLRLTALFPTSFPAIQCKTPAGRIGIVLCISKQLLCLFIFRYVWTQTGHNANLYFSPCQYQCTEIALPNSMGGCMFRYPTPSPFGPPATT